MHTVMNLRPNYKTGTSVGWWCVAHLGKED